MRKIIPAFLLLFAAFPLLNAQDYYLTKDLHASPIQVASPGALNNMLKAQKKEGKYQLSFLDITDTKAVFFLAPASLKAGLSEDGVTLQNGDGTLIIEVSIEPLPEGGHVTAFAGIKEDYKDSVKVAERHVVNNGIPIDILVFSDEEEGSVQTYFIVEYDGRLVTFSAQSTGENRGKHTTTLFNMAKSLGTAVIKGGGAAKPAASDAAAAQKQPAQTQAKAAAAAAAALAAQESRGAKKQVPFTALKDKLSKDGKTVAYTVNAEGVVYAFEVPAAATGSVKEGRFFLTSRAYPGHVFFMEILNPQSKTYFDGQLKAAGASNLRDEKGQNIEVSGKSVRLLRKTGLNKAAFNYLFSEEDDDFIISYIGLAENEKHFDAFARGIISTIEAL